MVFHTWPKGYMRLWDYLGPAETDRADVATFSGIDGRAGTSWKWLFSANFNDGNLFSLDLQTCFWE